MEKCWRYFFLDEEKDMIVGLIWRDGRLFYELETPNHHTGNLIRNFAKLCALPLFVNEKGLQVIRGEIPGYVTSENQEVYILRLADTKVANIYPDGRIERKAAVPAIAKTLMSQTKDYRLGAAKTIFKTYIRKDVKFHTDLHTHMNGNLTPDVLIALGIVHQIRYPLYYVRKLGLVLTERQEKEILQQRSCVEAQFVNSDLKGKYLERRINDNTFLNFADLILNNPENAEQNIVKIRDSLAVLKDGQAVFTNLEKVYLYRYVFTKGRESDRRIQLDGIDGISDDDVREAVQQMLQDRRNPAYRDNTLFQDKLLWIARAYRRQGIDYAEISDTTLVKKYESLRMLAQVHEILPKVQQETGVLIRFLAAMRRIPLTIVKDQVTPENYLASNLNVLHAVAADPYVAGCDFVGEEINDVRELAPAIREVVRIAKQIPDFVIRIHAGENDNLRDNVAGSIDCVRNVLEPGQEMPHLRIGHGLYTCSLKSKKGRELLESIRDNKVVLEFQITSNVRLNNLNNLAKHPLHQYLQAGVRCVQGTDGGPLYGTNSVDEQLSLEKMLNLTHEEMLSMRRTEDVIRRSSEDTFRRKYDALRQEFAANENAGKKEKSTQQGTENLWSRAYEEALLNRMEEAESRQPLELASCENRLLDANTALESQIEELPWDKLPVVVSGGSFNSQNRTTRVTKEGAALMDRALETADPRRIFFVIGHSLQGYERYILKYNEQLVKTGKRPFLIFAIVPSRLTQAQVRAIQRSGVRVRVSTESQAMGIYKSFNYEIFERRPSTVIAIDGNSAALNLIQEAKNGKGDASIMIWERAAALRRKADSLEGYVTIFGR